MRSRWRWVWRWGSWIVAIGLSGQALLSTSHDSTWFGHPEFLVRDTLMRANRDTQAHPQIAIVDINDASLNSIGPWPWSRQQLAQLVDHLLSHDQAQRVVLDMVLPEAKDPAGDAQLLRLAQSQRLILAQALDYVPREQAVRVGQLSGAQLTGSESALATGYIANHAGLLMAPCVGNIGYIPDSDGQVRRLPLWTTWQGQHYPSLALAAITCGQTELSSATRAHAAAWPIPYRYSYESFDSLSAQEILDPAAPAGRLHNKIVLVGASALGLSDQVATPLSNHASGVMVHASALAGLLKPSSDSSWNSWLAWPLMLVMISLLWLLMLGIFSSWGHWRWILVLPTLGTWYVWASHAIQSANPITISAPLMGMSILLVVLLPLEWWFTRQLFQRSLQLLSQYVGPTVLQELSQQDYSQVLEPQLKEVTVLVVDLEGYTQLVTRSSLEEAAQLTKRFLSLMTDVILAYQGTLDKYTGDGLIAFWGAPGTQVEDAQQAVRAAVALQSALSPWNEERQAQGLQALTIRVGVATGPALVGDLGTAFRSTYTAVGSCVNLASRLQLAARHQRVKILVDNRTRQKIQGLSFHALGPIEIRGRDLPEHVFSPL